MHKNFLIFFILFLLIIATSLVLIFKPKTHKPIVFENRDFKLELISQSAEVNIPKAEVNIEIGAPKINIETPVVSVKVETPEINIKTKEIQTAKTTTQKQTTPKTTQTKTANTKDNTVTQKKTTQTKKETEKQIVKQAEKKKEQNKTEAPEIVFNQTEKPVVTTPKVQEQKTTPQKQLTQEELEIIAWNKWRSDLQNQLMRDSKISAPIGTRFMFSFTVDKFGTITNLKTWSNNPSYTPLAVRVIKPILLGYQGKAILNFPANSKRITTNVDGGFTMAHTSNYSKPSDYNDYERVKK